MDPALLADVVDFVEFGNGSCEDIRLRVVKGGALQGRFVLNDLFFDVLFCQWNPAEIFVAFAQQKVNVVETFIASVSDKDGVCEIEFFFSISSRMSA